MKTKTPNPFSAGNDHTNACVNFMGDMGGAYSEGYRLAAELLTSHVESTNQNHDFLVYPIGYLYRHHLELQLKQIIRIGRKLLDKDGTHPGHHKLSELWPLAKGILREAAGNESDPPEFGHVDRFVGKYADVDFDAQAFRFPTKSRGGRSLDGVTHINLSTLRDAVEPLASFLWGCEAWLSELLQMKHEMQAELAREAM